MEQIVSAVVAAITSLISQMADKWGTGLGFGAIATLLSWIGVEHLTPATWPARNNRITASAIGTALTMLAHFGGIVSYGAGGQGFAAAAVYGMLGGAAAWPFHDLLAKRFLPAALLRPANGAKP